MVNRSLLHGVLTSTLILLFHINTLGQSEDRSKTINEIDSLRKQLNEKEMLFLSPAAEDFAAYAEFLKQPKTGLIRLFPRGLYENKLTLSGGGAFYSFAHLTHEFGYGSDIVLQFRNNDYNTPPIAEYYFVGGVTAGASIGFLAMLGDIPLEKVTLEHDAVKSLVAYYPPSVESEAHAVQRRLFAGIGINWLKFSGGNLAIPNHTYILRSITFNKSDVLVAFRVVRREMDGSLVILWKMLMQFPRPVLFRLTASR